MNKTEVVFFLLCFLAAAAIVWRERRKSRKTMEHIEKMLDAAMDGSFSETTFDESKLSALETKFAHYLSAAETSSRNLAREKDKIKALVADISHQTKTPIANLLLYSELLQEEALPPSTEANVDTLHAQAKKLQFLIDALVKLSRLENGIISLLQNAQHCSRCFKAPRSSTPPRLSKRDWPCTYTIPKLLPFLTQNGQRKP